jgi:hypothetical protein
MKNVDMHWKVNTQQEQQGTSKTIMHSLLSLSHIYRRPTANSPRPFFNSIKIVIPTKSNDMRLKLWAETAKDMLVYVLKYL